MEVAAAASVAAVAVAAVVRVQPEPPKDDPWGSAPASGSFSGADDEPPF